MKGTNFSNSLAGEAHVKHSLLYRNQVRFLGVISRVLKALLTRQRMPFVKMHASYSPSFFCLIFLTGKPAEEVACE